MSLITPALAHEPLIGLGPHTLYRGGFSAAMIYDRTQNTDESGVQSATLGMTYGLTEEINLSASVPYIRRELGETAEGVGDAVLQVKWRVLKHLAPQVVDAISLIGALKLPSGAKALTTGDSAYVLGITAAREQLRYYVFGTVRYASFDAGFEQKLGDVLLYDVAVGGRPWVAGYEDPDLVLLVELNGMLARGQQSEGGSLAQAAGALQCGSGSTPAGIEQACFAHSAGATGAIGGRTDAVRQQLALTPEALLSWRNWMIKAGVQIPVWQRTGGGPEQSYRAKADLIVQW